MSDIKEILANIKSIGYFLASKKDVNANSEFYEKAKLGGKEIAADITDLKLSDLQHNLNYLNEYFTRMEVPTITKIKICIASSHSLKEEREEIETWLFRKNDELVDKGVYLYYNVWEKQSLRFNHSYKQEDFNKALVYESDIFICLIGDNVGKFTKEEFDEAKLRFDRNEKPYVFYVYFKNFAGAELEKISESDGWQKRVALKNHIGRELGQCSGSFSNQDELLRLIERGLLEDIDIVKSRRP